MILSAHQPAYLPWLGYFDKIKQCDMFIFLDSVQYEKNSFTNRNKIKSPQGPIWLTVPVRTKGHIDKQLCEIEVDNRQNWRRKHLNAIYLNYKKAPCFDRRYNALETLYQKEHELLSELCWEHLMFWLDQFNIHKKVIKSSRLELTSKKSDLILDLCKMFNAGQYLSGALGKDYLVEADFQQEGISVSYQSFEHPIYLQLWGEFVPYMSIIDYWMNVE